jgi:hypothetical protein
VARLEKKGHRAERVGGAGKKSKLIKVMVGEFPEKKDAEALAAELRAGGADVKAFVVKKNP